MPAHPRVPPLWAHAARCLTIAVLAALPAAAGAATPHAGPHSGWPAIMNQDDIRAPGQAYAHRPPRIHRTRTGPRGWPVVQNDGDPFAVRANGRRRIHRSRSGPRGWPLIQNDGDPHAVRANGRRRIHRSRTGSRHGWPVVQNEGDPHAVRANGRRRMASDPEPSLMSDVASQSGAGSSAPGGEQRVERPRDG